MRPELAFAVREIVPDPHSAAPTLVIRLAITEKAGTAVHLAALRIQVKIDAHRRHYLTGEQERLGEQFGTPDRWDDTLRPFTWTHTSAMVQGFEGSSEVDVPLPCTYDFEVLGSRFLESLDGGSVPLELLFSGTVVVPGDNGFEVHQIPWHSAARHDLPVARWRELMDAHYPNAGWIRLHRDTILALRTRKAAVASPSWDDLLLGMLAADEEAS